MGVPQKTSQIGTQYTIVDYRICTNKDTLVMTFMREDTGQLPIRNCGTPHGNNKDVYIYSRHSKTGSLS